MQARATVDETRFLLELARRNDWIRGVVGWEDLTCEGLGERLQDWRAEPRLCGWRHQVQDEPDAAAFLGCAAFGRGMALLQRQGWAYDLLVFHHQMEAAAAFCAFCCFGLLLLLAPSSTGRSSSFPFCCSFRLLPQLARRSLLQHQKEVEEATSF